MIDLASTGLWRSYRLYNKPKQKYGIFAKFSLEVVLACEVAINPHILLPRENQHIQEINRHFGGDLYHFSTMVFSENQEQN